MVGVCLIAAVSASAARSSQSEQRDAENAVSPTARTDDSAQTFLGSSGPQRFEGTKTLGSRMPFPLKTSAPMLRLREPPFPVRGQQAAPVSVEYPGEASEELAARTHSSWVR